MKEPYFSIVIPTFNRSELFPYAVRSVLNQTFNDFEIVLSDNCSGDDTPQVARQFTDARFKYVQTPRHYTIADAWEFARSQARGTLVIMLADDDTLVDTTLERFYAESSRGGDFVFSGVTEYRDSTYPGKDRNSVTCPAFSGQNYDISAEKFIRPVFAYENVFDMHPSAYAFTKRIADEVAAKTGRFFWTNGVEYSAWPIAAIHAKRIVHVDLPLTVLGRTGKSWGSNIALCNPGRERIQDFIKDIDHTRKHAPLNNFTMYNLITEGVLTAKSLFPREFEPYQFDEIRYLKGTMTELRGRAAIGVDVSKEIADLLQYSAKFPDLLKEFNSREKANVSSRVRTILGNLGIRAVRERLAVRKLEQKLAVGGAAIGFFAAGKDFGFSDILECTEFLGRVIELAMTT